MAEVRRWLAALFLGSLIATAAYRRGALSASGAAGAAVVGTITFAAGGVLKSALLLLFFGSSSALSRVAKTKDDGADAGPQRSLIQVLANGGIPSAVLLLAAGHPSGRLAAAYAGALAAANADTWATEIGALSKSPPRMIPSGKIVQRGISGAITPLGTAASLAGAAVIGAAESLLTGTPTAAPRVAAAGFAGALADTFLGASLQAVYHCRGCAMRTEDRHHHHGDAAPSLTLMRGVPWMTNDTVNLCASLTGALLAALLAPRSKA